MLVSKQSHQQSIHTSSNEDTDGLLNHLWRTVQGNDTMGELDKNKLYHLLVAYRDMFAADKSDFGHTNHIQHTIETDGASPYVRGAGGLHQPSVRRPLRCYKTC